MSSGGLVALDQRLASGDLGAYQVYLRDRSGDEFIWYGGADSYGRSVDATSTFRVYCAIKPLLAVLVGALVEKGEVSFDDRVGDLMAAPEHCRELLVSDLLRHASGVSAPDPLKFVTLTGHERLAEAFASCIDRVQEPGFTTLYSEASTWNILARGVEEMMGSPIEELARERVLEPLGVVDQFDIGNSEGTRLVMNVARYRSGFLPLLIERTEQLEWGANPGFGGSATVRGLGALALEYMAALQGQGKLLGKAVAREMLSGSRKWDARLGHECVFGLGWMLSLSDFDFSASAVSRAAFGHVGLTGMTAVWADPKACTVGAYHVNTMMAERSAAAEVRNEILSFLALRVQ